MKRKKSGTKVGARWLSLLLSFCMLLTLVPVTAFAGEAESPDEATTQNVDDLNAQSVQDSGDIAVQGSDSIAVQDSDSIAVQDSGSIAVQDSASIAVQDSGSIADQNDTVIQNIAIVNATVSYYAGDAPQATASKGDADAPNYEIAYECWEEMEQTSQGPEPVAFWYSDPEKMQSVPEGKRITTFEEGKSYMYSIELRAKDGYTFATVDTGLTMTLNGEDVRSENLINSGGTGTILTAVALKTIRPTAPVQPIETETADFTTGGGTDAINLLNQAKTPGAANSTWDNSSRTLTLKGIDFTTTAATAVKLPANSTIILADGTTNTIKSGDATSNVNYEHRNHVSITALDAVGNLTIQGGANGTGTLSVTSGSHKNSGDGWTYSSGITVDGDFIVKGGHVTAQGGLAEVTGDGLAFSIGVNMTSNTRNKALMVTGGSLTAIGGESYCNETDTERHEEFSRGVYLYRGNVSVSGNGKLTAQSESMGGAGILSNGLYISVGDLLIANDGEVLASGIYGAYISGGGIRIDNNGKLTAVSNKDADGYYYGSAINVGVDSTGTNTGNAGSITVNGGTLKTEGANIYMSTYNATETQGLFTVTGGTVVNEGSLYGAKKVDISGGTVQTQQIDADELSLSNAALTIREPVYESSYNGHLYASPALNLKKLTVNSGTLDVAWDWGEYTPIVFPVDEYSGYPTPLVKMTTDTAIATFNGGTTILDTGMAGNTALKLGGQLILGDGMEETGADANHCQLSSDVPVKFEMGAPSPIINEVVIANVKFDYQPGDTPQKSATIFLPNDVNRYEISYECWEEMENGEPVAFWYSDESKYTSSMKRITQFEEGKSYMYSIELRAKDGYDFADNCSVTINNNLVNTANVNKTQNGLFVTAVKTIKPVTKKEIDVIEINDATTHFNAGDKPVFTGKVPDGAPYVIDFERWTTDGAGITSSDYWNQRYGDHEGSWGELITTFEAGKTYNYGLYLKLTPEAEAEGYYFGPDTKLKVNGQDVGYVLPEPDEDIVWWIGTDLTMTPTVAGDSSTDNNTTNTNTNTNANADANGSSTDGKNSSNPQTGDNNNLIAWFGILLASSGGILALTLNEKRKRRNK